MSTRSYNRFTGRTAVVTGAGAGIGAAVAMALAAEGSAVTVADIDGRAAAEVADALAAGGSQALAIEADVSDENQVQLVFSATVGRFGRLDFVVNNAGIVIYGAAPGYAQEDWDKVLAINLKGQFLMAKHAIPLMCRQGGGAIVNMASVQGLASQRQVPAYAASKGGVLALTRSLAIDHAAAGVRVNSVLPGSVRTPMLMHAIGMAEDGPEAALARCAKAHPRGSIIEPQEVANVVLFLLSDDASAVTGAAFTVDAGLSAQLAQ